MTHDTTWATVVAALLMWQTLLFIPMVPGKLVDTRDFSPLPRWQYNGFNVFLVSLGIASFTTVWALMAGNGWYSAAAIIAVLYFVVFMSDLMEVFPVVPDKLPVQLLVLEVMSLATAGALFTLAIRGVLG